MDDHRGRTLLIAAGLVLGAGVLALLLTNLMRGPGDVGVGPHGLPAGAPTEFGGSAVITVADALVVQAADNANQIAVAGWYQESYPVPCPAPLPPVVPLLDGDCTIAMTWLMGNPETLDHATRDANGGSNSSRPPVGPAVNPVFDGPSTDWANPLPELGDSIPTPVVFVGHFDDARAAGCKPEDRQACLDRFVVTSVAWANGHALP